MKFPGYRVASYYHNLFRNLGNALNVFKHNRRPFAAFLQTLPEQPRKNSP